MGMGLLGGALKSTALFWVALMWGHTARFYMYYVCVVGGGGVHGSMFACGWGSACVYYG